MGAEKFTTSCIARTAKEAYDYLVKIAEEEYGRDAYNGTISTCDLGKCIKAYKVYDKDMEEFERYRLSGFEKYVAKYIDLGVVYVDLVTVTSEPKNTDAKFAMKHVVYADCERTQFAFDSKKDAVYKAVEIALATGADTDVHKEYVRVSGQSCETSVTVRKQRLNEPPTRRLKKNESVIEYHKYLFYGYAAC